MPNVEILNNIEYLDVKIAVLGFKVFVIKDCLGIRNSILHISSGGTI